MEPQNNKVWSMQIRQKCIESFHFLSMSLDPSRFVGAHCGVICIWGFKIWGLCTRYLVIHQPTTRYLNRDLKHLLGHFPDDQLLQSTPHLCVIDRKFSFQSALKRTEALSCASVVDGRLNSTLAGLDMKYWETSFSLWFHRTGGALRQQQFTHSYIVLPAPVKENGYSCIHIHNLMHVSGNFCELSIFFILILNDFVF